MRKRLCSGVGLALALSAGAAMAQEPIWRPAVAASAAADEPIVTLGRPQPRVVETAPASEFSTPPAFVRVAPPQGRQPIFRAQSADLPGVNPPPPPPPGVGGAAVFPGPPPGVRPGEEAFNCGIVNNNADQGGFWTRTGDHFRRCWTDVTDSVGGMGRRSLFQSEHCFDEFISPVSHPVFFEDPRALTEFRTSFIWQHVPESNSAFADGSNYFVILQARVALTDYVSIVMNEIGWASAHSGGMSGNGMTELHIGPKVTFLRDECTKTLAAVGLNFEIPIGSSNVAQDTGSLSLSPYFSFGQAFGESPGGAFHFLSTVGYSFGIDQERSDRLYASVHLDYGFKSGPLCGFYPLVELNWTHYTFNGSARPFDFEGADLFNFGSTAVSGHNDLTLAAGARYKWSEALQFGLVGEVNLIGGGRHMDAFRFTADVIFRY